MVWAATWPHIANIAQFKMVVVFYKVIGCIAQATTDMHIWDIETYYPIILIISNDPSLPYLSHILCS